MEQKIFLLIATFCIAQVKSQPNGYPGNFPDIALLSDVYSLWCTVEPTRSCFQVCYKNASESHKLAIDRFHFQITYATDRLQFNLNKWQNVKYHEKKIKSAAEKLGNLLKEYQKKLLTHLTEKNFGQIRWLIRDYKITVGRAETKLNNEFKRLKATRIIHWDQGYIKTCEKTFEEELTKLTERCDAVMKSLKECMETCT